MSVIHLTLKIQLGEFYLAQKKNSFAPQTRSEEIRGNSLFTGSAKSQYRKNLHRNVRNISDNFHYCEALVIFYSWTDLNVSQSENKHGNSKGFFFLKKSLLVKTSEVCQEQKELCFKEPQLI